MKMEKCQICKVNQSSWIWQPFGPAEDAFLFTFPGSHYRGFPAIKVCDDCRGIIQKNEPVDFYYKGRHYIGNIHDIREVPAYVGDPLLWWEEQG
jgi:hypothetical protein